jgi:hypothetical protein
MSKLVYTFDWGQVEVPQSIAELASVAPRREYKSFSFDGPEDFIAQEEPDCPELDAWAKATNAQYWSRNK